ncbi:hypothetical protein [Hyphomicrobium sp.]
MRRLRRMRRPRACTLAPEACFR